MNYSVFIADKFGYIKKIYVVLMMEMLRVGERTMALIEIQTELEKHINIE